MRIADLNQDGIGLDGIDPVAAANGELLKGDPALNSTFENTRYHFVSEENMEKFEEDPSRYIPLAGSPASGNYLGDPNRAEGDVQYDAYPATNRALEDEEFAMEKSLAEDEPGFGEQEPDDEDLAKTNLYEGE